MSKFTIVIHDQNNCHLFCDRGPVIGKHLVERFSLDELPALYSCIGAAMAESGPACKCDPQEWGGDKPDDICPSYLGTVRDIAGRGHIEICRHCGHDKACHQPQEPASQKEEQ